MIGDYRIPKSAKPAEERLVFMKLAALIYLYKMIRVFPNLSLACDFPLTEAETGDGRDESGRYVQIKKEGYP